MEDREELAEVLGLLLAEPLQRHSQGHAAVQGAAKIGDSMMTIAWEVCVSTSIVGAAWCLVEYVFLIEALSSGA